MVKVTCENLTKFYGKFKGIDGINLEIEDGEYIAVLGPTGAGKTTTMYVIAGLIQPSAGQVKFDDVDFTNIPAEDRNVGFVFEEYNLFPRMTVEKNVLFGPIVKKHDLNDAVKISGEMFHLLNISGKEEAYPNQVSGGQKQRVALARAIVSGAQLLIMDDPLRALDAKIREMLQVELRKLVKDLGLTCIHATHDIHEAMNVADKIAVFQEGRVAQFGTPEEIYNNPKTLEIASFLSESSTFEGVIRERKNEKYLETGDSILVKVVTDLEEGTEAIALIPSELVDIKPLEKRDELNYDNIVEATLLDFRCIGEFYEYSLETLGTTIKGKELIGTTFIHKTESKVLFATDKDDYRVFKKEK
jgi:ABC-type Fe3+/spermidine/putrescine transport system ATPase subunit